MDASFWFFRSYFATVFLLDSPTFAVTVFARVVLRGLLGNFFPAELGAPNVQDLCVCAC